MHFSANLCKYLKLVSQCVQSHSVSIRGCRNRCGDIILSFYIVLAADQCQKIRLTVCKVSVSCLSRNRFCLFTVQ
jgi:hypothetical protein